MKPGPSGPPRRLRAGDLKPKPPEAPREPVKVVHQAPDVPAYYGRTDLRAYFFILAFLVLSFLIYNLTDGPRWSIRAIDTAIYLFVAAAAVFLYGGPVNPVSHRFRLLFACLVSGTVLAALFVGDPFAYAVTFYFFLLLPIWVVVPVLGTARRKLTRLQVLGASLLLGAIWRPIYGTLPDLTDIFTATGRLEPLSLSTLWRMTTLKYYHEIFFVLIGLLLITRTMPLVQKPPRWPADFKRAFGAIGANVKRNWWIDCGFGAFALIVSYVGSLLLINLFSRTTIGSTGADDSSYFDNMIPILVVLLSFAAGLGEELVYRALLQPALQRWARNLFPAHRPALMEWGSLAVAIVIQAVIFGIVHAGYSSLSHVLIPMAFGLWMGIVFRFFGFLACVWTHTMIDIIAFGSDTFDSHPWMVGALWFLLLFNLLYGLGTVAWVTVTALHRRHPPPTALPSTGA